MSSSQKENLLFIHKAQAPARKFSISTFFICYSIAVAPFIYFLNKNYGLLDEIGFKFFPSLLDINTNDKILVLSLCTISFFLGLLIHIIAQDRFIRRIYVPLNLLHAHISGLIHGDFHQDNIPLKQGPYISDLLRNYNYLYNSLQSNLKKDITFLKELEVHYDADLVRILIQEKSNQLNMTEEKDPPETPNKDFHKEDLFSTTAA